MKQIIARLLKRLKKVLAYRGGNGQRIIKFRRDSRVRFKPGTEWYLPGIWKVMAPWTVPDYKVNTPDLGMIHIRKMECDEVVRVPVTELVEARIKPLKILSHKKGVSMKQLLASTKVRLETAATYDNKELDAIGKKGFEDIASLMKSKGYKKESQKQSAMIHITYSNPKKPNLRFTVCGWHGTGKWSGSVVVFSLFYTTKHDPEKPHISDMHENMIGDFNSLKGTVEDEKKIISDILTFLKKTA
jgi:hypothetical protein